MLQPFPTRVTTCSSHGRLAMLPSMNRHCIPAFRMAETRPRFSASENVLCPTGASYAHVRMSVKPAAFIDDGTLGSVSKLVVVYSIVSFDPNRYDGTPLAHLVSPGRS